MIETTETSYGCKKMNRIMMCKYVLWAAPYAKTKYDVFVWGLGGAVRGGVGRRRRGVILHEVTCTFDATAWSYSASSSHIFVQVCITSSTVDTNKLSEESSLNIAPTPRNEGLSDFPFSCTPGKSCHDAPPV